MNGRTKQEDFKEKVFPHLEILLQFSLSLTKNGRDAATLLREAMAEAYRSWDESIPEPRFRFWLHKILTRRFYNDFQRRSRPPVPICGDNIDDSLVKNNRLFSTATSDTRQQSSQAGELDEDVECFKAVAGLPRVYRSAMILSYLEGFTHREIAGLAGVKPHAVESLLNRGRRFLREELFSHLVGNGNLENFTDQAKASG